LKTLSTFFCCCCLAMTVAVGQVQSAPADRDLHNSADESYAPTKANLLNSEGSIEPLRSDHRSALRVDNRVSVRSSGPSQAGRRVSTLRSGISVATGKTRLTGNNMSLSIGSAELRGPAYNRNLSLTDNPLSLKDSSAIESPRASGSELCCSALLTRRAPRVGSIRARSVSAASSPFDHPLLGLTAFAKTATHGKEGPQSRESADEFREPSFDRFRQPSFSRLRQPSFSTNFGQQLPGASKLNRFRATQSNP
jgi:hypothetical protein